MSIDTGNYLYENFTKYAFQKKAARKLDKIINKILSEETNPLDKLVPMAQKILGAKQNRSAFISDQNTLALSHVMQLNEHPQQLNAFKDLFNKATNTSDRLKQPVFKNVNNSLKRLTDSEFNYGKNGISYEDARKKSIKNLKDGYKHSVERRKNSLKSDVVNTRFGENNNVDPEKYIDIEHGGGYAYLQDVIKNKVKGYSLEGYAGEGIQVSPVSESNFNRTNAYATQAGVKNLDYPAVLKGRIKAKYLQDAPNKYEAGLRTENIKHVKDLSLNKLTLDAIKENKGVMPYVDDGISSYLKKEYDMDIKNMYDF